MRIGIQELFELYLQNPRIVTDSRKVIPGCIFAALKGESFDGNTFAATALSMGARYSLIDNPDFDSVNTLLVEDTLSALQQIASLYRKTWKFPVIGITGTNGKTTTKELITTVLSSHYKVHATQGNLNNHIGVPLTILETPIDTEIAVIEMGANHQGEIGFLCTIADPTHGLITNIGKAHLEGFGGYEGVIRAKSELYHHLRNKKGIVFVNADNPLLLDLSKGMQRVQYGSGKNVLVRGNILNANPYLSVSAVVNSVTMDLNTKLVGMYNFENVLSAVCAGSWFEVPTQKIITSIEAYTPTNNRSQSLRTATNLIIMDAYNANPSSMKAALQNFNETNFEKKVAILGDMLELGDESEFEHKEVINLLISLNLSDVILVGPEFGKVADTFKVFPDSSAALEWLKANPIKGCTILVKGSRGIKMEKVLEAL